MTTNIDSSASVPTARDAPLNAPASALDMVSLSPHLSMASFQRPIKWNSPVTVSGTSANATGITPVYGRFNVATNAHFIEVCTMYKDVQIISLSVSLLAHLPGTTPASAMVYLESTSTITADPTAPLTMAARPGVRVLTSGPMTQGNLVADFSETPRVSFTLAPAIYSRLPVLAYSLVGGTSGAAILAITITYVTGGSGMKELGTF